MEERGCFIADKGFISAILNGLETNVRKVLYQAFEHTLDTFRLGGNTKATNFAWYQVAGTTAPTAWGEFSLEHGLGRAPSKLIPVMDLTAINSRLVNLQVTRAPDANRIYLASDSTSAAFLVYVE